MLRAFMEPSGQAKALSTMKLEAPQLTTEPAPLLNVNNARQFLGGISRSGLYNLLQIGEIKGVSLRAKGQVRGRRMILRESLEDYVKRISETA
jgi:hypothetical protein